MNDKNKVVCAYDHLPPELIRKIETTDKQKHLPPVKIRPTPKSDNQNTDGGKNKE